MNITRLPNPPLRYWPRPPIIEASILDQNLPSCSPNKETNAASLTHHLSQLTEIQQQVNRHYHEVVEWAERCHAESVAARSPSGENSEGNEWLYFIRKVKLYLNDRLSRRSKEIEDATQVTLEQLTTLRQNLVARLEQLEGQFDDVHERRQQLLLDQDEPGRLPPSMKE